MNNILKVGVGVVLGAGAGAFGSYIFCRKKYIKELNEQLEHIYKCTQSNKEIVEKNDETEEEPKEFTHTVSSFEKPDLTEYLKNIKESHYDYTNPASNLEDDEDETEEDDESIPEDVVFYGEKTDVELKDPYPINKADFGKDDRPRLYYTSYGPTDITDEYGNELTEFEIEDLFGENYDSFFNEWAEKRKLHIRNDVTGCDYEILYDDSYTPAD